MSDARELSAEDVASILSRKVEAAGRIALRDYIAMLTEQRDAAQTAQREIEHKYRERLWLGHGHSFHQLYGDDGEMQCAKCKCDYKRDPLEQVERLTTQALALHAPKEATNG